MKDYNCNIERVISLSRELMVLADEGDDARTDDSCGVLYGMVRDCAYKLRARAEEEKLKHKEKGIWESNKKSETVEIRSTERKVKL